MFLKKHNSTTLKPLFFISKNSVFSVINRELRNPPFMYIQTKKYVNVYMKWKKDPYYDSIEEIHNSTELKRIISFKNVIAQSYNGCIPISDVSKRGLEFDVKIKVASFLREYPSIFEEFTGPKYNLPWFRLTSQAAEIDREERSAVEACKDDLRERLKKFILMNKEKMLPLTFIKCMSWYLGLPEGFLQYPYSNLDDSFKLVKLEGGFEGLCVESQEKILSFLQINTIKRGIQAMEPIEFPLFPSKGLRLKKKIKDWLTEFQKLPYVSPYEDYSNFNPDSDISEKRVVGFLHELLCLFVEHSAERNKLLCLRKYFGLPQKFYKAFQRHPHMFYLSLRNKTCTVILKEPYCDKLAVGSHPMLRIRKKYIDLMKESKVILARRSSKKPLVECPQSDLDFDSHANPLIWRHWIPYGGGRDA